jgi:thiamine-phosphate pyrophosphorylase
MANAGREERSIVRATLAESVRLLNLRDRADRSLPTLILLTDEHRLPNPVAAVRWLPRGSAVILRHYAAPDRAALARTLARLCRARGVRLIVAGDWRLAAAVGAGGVHLPEGMARRGRMAWGGGAPKPPGFVVTAAAHSPGALWRAWRAGADAALLSPVFATASHPGAAGLGVLRFAGWCRRAPLAVYALGGVNPATARRLAGSGLAGIAGIGGLAGGIEGTEKTVTPKTREARQG